MDNEPLSNRYNAHISGSESINEQDCWILELTAKNKTESYPTRKLWIDKRTGDCLSYELYALSGVKLKEYNIIRIENIGNKRFPTEFEIRDLLRRNSKTTFKMTNVVLDKPIPDSVFSLRNLEQ
jgi:outer membrane lipoprotein-sorting protein